VSNVVINLAHLKECDYLGALFVKEKVKHWNDTIKKARNDCIKRMKDLYIETGEVKMQPCYVLIHSDHFYDFSNRNKKKCFNDDHREKIVANLSDETKKYIKEMEFNTDWSKREYYDYRITINTDKV
jgi:hypothetical protein